MAEALFDQLGLNKREARELVEQALESARGFADGYGVETRIDPISQRADVHPDPDRLTQVITNLLSNAIKFSPERGDIKLAFTRHDASPFAPNHKFLTLHTKSPILKYNGGTKGRRKCR